MELDVVVQGVAVGLLVIVFGYVFVRSVSFAYFRTKLEYLREAMKELKEK